MCISSTEKSAKNEKMVNHVFCITGFLEHFNNRDELIKVITDSGGKVSGSVSAKTDYLINNDVNSILLKNQKAKNLSIPIITENDFLAMMN